MSHLPREWVTYREMTLPSPCVSASWLQQHLEAVTILDVRAFDADAADEPTRDRIPYARWVPFEELDGPARPGRGGRRPLPEPEAFARTLNRVGVREGTSVVVYDDMRGSRAARLWWMLDSWDFDVAVLDGGFAAWSFSTASGLRSACTEGDVVARDWPRSHFVDADEVDGRSHVLLDARGTDRFHGAPHKLDPVPGHMPGARSAPWTENVSDDDGCLLPLDALRTRFESLGALGETPVILSCGSGVTACHNALVHRQLGVSARVYVGSWSEWAASTRPIVNADGELVHPA